MLCIYGALAYHKNPKFVYLFKGIQILQLLALYSWYVGFGIPFSNSLPFYHCRLAMFAVVFLPDKWKSKQYFALLGASGAVFALVYPVFDPYDFPHITSFSFLIGHYALLVNSLVYLMNHYDKSLLKKYMIVAYTFILNLFLVGVNQVTGGNYGLLNKTPFIPDAPPVAKVPTCVCHPFTGSGSFWYLIQKTVEKEKTGEISALAYFFHRMSNWKTPQNPI